MSSNEKLNTALTEPLAHRVFQTLGLNFFKIFHLKGDASSRRYFRLKYNQKSWILMLRQPFDKKLPFLQVRQLFKDNHIRVPSLEFFSASEGAVLLEDLTDHTLEDCYKNEENALVFYKQAIDELINIQAIKPNKNHIAFKHSFDSEKLMWEFNFTFKHLFENFFRISFTKAEEQLIQSQFKKISLALEKQISVLCHRDYHSRNLMIKDKRLCLIDFQDARMGSIYYDIVSLLKDSYVDMSPEDRSLLLEYFIEQKEKFGEKINLEEFMYSYELQTIQRCLKACGSFAGLFILKERGEYLQYLPKTLKDVESSISFFSEYKELKNLFENKGIFSGSVLIA